MTSRTRRDPEAGFSLLEVIMCIGLVLLGSAVALGLLPSLVHGSQQDLLRMAATDAGRNALERIRAAAAYYPTTGGAGDLTNTSDHAWAFVPGLTSTTRIAARVHRALCATAASTTNVTMSLTTTYDRAGDSVRIVVAYPRNPCDATVRDSVTLVAPLAAAQWYPQTTLATPINDPALQ